MNSYSPDTLKMFKVATELTDPSKGILGSDSSGKFNQNSIKQYQVEKLPYRNLTFDAPNIEKVISGIIIFCDGTDLGKSPYSYGFNQVLKSKAIHLGVEISPSV